MEPWHILALGIQVSSNMGGGCIFGSSGQSSGPSGLETPKIQSGNRACYIGHEVSLLAKDCPWHIFGPAQ